MYSEISQNFHIYGCYFDKVSLNIGLIIQTNLYLGLLFMNDELVKDNTNIIVSQT